MDGKKFFQTIRLENILSYGPGNGDFPLEPLNVLIGRNGSGKSNLIKALSLLGASPLDIQHPIRLGGGVNEWLWKGVDEFPTATIEVTLESRSKMPLRYKISFTEIGQRFQLLDEVVENFQPYQGHSDTYHYYRYQNGKPVLNIIPDPENGVESMRSLWPSPEEDISDERSILSHKRGANPELSYLATNFENMLFYREWSFAEGMPPRSPQKLTLPRKYLLEDSSNLSLVLSSLLKNPDVKGKIIDRFKNFYPEVNDIIIDAVGNTVQLFLHEGSLHHPVPATCLSAGSLRYLCLLVILYHPDPPPIICIEEPETNLHPDVISEVAKLLLEASNRSQIFVTTHSDILVDALTNTPESIIICEKTEDATHLHRLSSEDIKSWLEDYRLGEIWMTGAVGGTRW